MPFVDNGLEIESMADGSHSDGIDTNWDGCVPNVRYNKIGVSMALDSEWIIDFDNIIFVIDDCVSNEMFQVAVRYVRVIHRVCNI